MFSFDELTDNSIVAFGSVTGKIVQQTLGMPSKLCNSFKDLVIQF